jgi:tetratricopeptide (TPR) repeat protein
MTETLSTVRGWGLAIVVTALMLWLMWLWFKSSRERGQLVAQWVLTGVNGLFIGLVIAPMMRQGGINAAFGVLAGALAGLFMALIWAPSITAYVGGKVGALYDGGDVEADPEPAFSIAEARRKQGAYQEAADEVRDQLNLFPHDFRGWMLLAEIYAEDLRDLAAAHAAVEELLAQPGHAPKNVAFALTRLAEWNIKLARDPAAARACFERILELYPDSTEAHLAEQRIAHLATPELLAAPSEPAIIPLPPPAARPGFQPDFAAVKVAGRDPAERAAALVRQLEAFPHDNQAREDLAVLYAGEFHRLDLATEQLEQLLAQPHALDGQVVRWLNLLSDFYTHAEGGAEAARAALERLVARLPGTAAAETARARLATLNLRARAAQQGQVVKLGVYEQNIGLKSRDSDHP